MWWGNLAGSRDQSLLWVPLSLHGPVHLFTRLFFFNLWLHRVFFPGFRPSLVGATQGYSNCGAWASHCSGFSCCEYRLWVSRWLSGKESTCNAGDSGDAGSIPGLRRSPGEGNGTPLQYSCLGNPMDRGAGRAAAHGVTKMLDTTEVKSDQSRQFL